jgi:hypothetical protein
MIKIVRITDRLPVIVDGVTFYVAPLSSGAKAELLQAIEEKGGESKFDTVKYIKTLIKHCLKAIEGLEDMHGEPYKLSFDDSGLLTEDCVEELTQLAQVGKAMGTIANFSLNLRIEAQDGVEVQPVLSAEKLSQKKTD